MGHKVVPHKEHQLLQQRLDKMVTGAPDSPVLMKILKLLFTPEEAALARRIPVKPTSLAALSKKLEMPEDELQDKLTELAQRGVVVDFMQGGKHFYLLPPVVIGFFEFVFMRAREDLPMKELAELFHEYLYDGEGAFSNSVFRKQTQIGRSLVREEALPMGDHTEILDYERASHIIQTASAVGVSMCACRHKAMHLGDNCDAPMEVCMTFNRSATTMVHSGIAKAIDVNEGMRLLDQCKEAGLAQTGDNVQQEVGYMCNCCGCCCGMMNGIRRFDIKNAIVTSNWTMTVDAEHCKGCGQCAKACPINAIDMAPTGSTNGKPKKQAQIENELCLGCGVCYSACKFEGLKMKAREQRVLTPEGTFDRIVSMAIERGKVADLLFDEPENLSFRALGRILHILENSPPAKALLAIKPLKSAFLNTLVKGAKRVK